MKTVSKITITLVLTAVGAFANEHLTQIRDHAKDLEQGFRGIQTVVRDKNFDESALRTRMDATSATVDKLKTLAAEFETANPTVAASPDWKTAKERIVLIEIFRNEKEKLMGDAKKQRGMIKAHAEGMARRAAMLLESSDRLLKTSGT